MSKHDGNSFYIGSFDWAMEDEIIAPLNRQIRAQAGRPDASIDLWVNSYGGYAHILFQLVEQVELAKRMGITIRTMVTDIAASCGSLLAVTGSPGERYVARTASHMVHYGSGGAMMRSPEEAERVSAEFKRHFDKIYNHYQRYAAIPDLRVKMQADRFNIPAEQCIEWGLADKLMEDFNLGPAL